MAIYSLNVATVGKSTHAPGTAGAHLRYIAREDAASHVEAAHMPDDPQQARSWMDSYEREARKNARLMNKVRLALPRELTHEQNVVLARNFVADLTGGRIPSFIAVHDQGKDARNPHAHIVLIDRDMNTGKRLLMLSDSPRDRRKAGLPENGVEWIRTKWEHHANQALERDGHEARIDRRTLEAQGIERDAQIHIGPRAQHIDSSVQRPESRPLPDPTPQRPSRVIDYPAIDAGRTRMERNAEIIDLNLERAARSPHFETRVWAQFERDQRAKDRPVQQQLQAAARRRTLEERRIRRAYAEQTRDIRSAWTAEARFTRDWLKQRHAPDTAALRTRHAAERDQLTQQQGRLFGRLVAAFSGRSRQKRAEERRALITRHKQERRDHAALIRSQRAEQGAAVAARHRPALEDVKRARTAKLTALRDRHKEELAREDGLLQQREAEREQAREVVREQIRSWKAAQRERERRDQGQERTALSGAWDRKDESSPPSKESRKEQVKREMREARERRSRDRDRGYERD